MAKKLKDTEKAITEDAALLKKAAHSARTRELSEAEKEAEQTANTSVFALEYKQAEAAAEAARRRRDDAINELEAQIALIRTEHDARIDELRAARNLAFSTFIAERSKMVDSIRTRFPDLAVEGALHSYSCWTPPAGYLEQFAAKYADELGRP